MHKVAWKNGTIKVLKMFACTRDVAKELCFFLNLYCISQSIPISENILCIYNLKEFETYSRNINMFPVDLMVASASIEHEVPGLNPRSGKFLLNFF